MVAAAVYPSTQGNLLPVMGEIQFAAIMAAHNIPQNRDYSDLTQSLLEQQREYAFDTLLPRYAWEQGRLISLYSFSKKRFTPDTKF